MSANNALDLGNGMDYFGSISSVSGANDIIGGIVDLINASQYTNVFVAGLGSGPLPILIQTSDSVASGSFTDPTSGLPTSVFPVGGRVVSGGIFWANSGLYQSGNSAPATVVNSAPVFCSGGVALAAFQRPHRYARLVCTSGNASLTAVNFTAGFLGQKTKTGASGTQGGYSLSPTSGTVNV